jgi:putative tryptophan/tyrosine transport system substrate-binding protein
MREAQAVAPTLGLEVATLEIRRAEDIAPALQTLKGGIDALYVTGHPLLTTNRVGISTLAASGKLPTMFNQREYVDAGGLMSYGSNFPDLFRHAADLLTKYCEG